MTSDQKAREILPSYAAVSILSLRQPGFVDEMLHCLTRVGWSRKQMVWATGSSISSCINATTGGVYFKPLRILLDIHQASARLETSVQLSRLYINLDDAIPRPQWNITHPQPTDHWWSLNSGLALFVLFVFAFSFLPSFFPISAIKGCSFATPSRSPPRLSFRSG